MLDVGDYIPYSELIFCGFHDLRATHFPVVAKLLDIFVSLGGSVCGLVPMPHGVSRTPAL